ncbi:family 15 putative glycosyltransferase [Dipodascopsis tothii]|uniref:family 15 putative glycosyltransferase n=1 Tax=Dipodascopsis tothii TaxID=44089 RepID=UPI0034CF3A1A
MLMKRARQLAVVFFLVTVVVYAISRLVLGPVVSEDRVAMQIAKEKEATPIANNPLADPVDEPEGVLVRHTDDGYRRANATLLSIVRNREVMAMVQTMREVERTFNSKYNYPWTFFNDEPFTENFKRRTQAMTQAECRYEVIPREHWDTPNWINPDLVEISNQILVEDNIQYGTMASYHRMCRWNSGLFYKHPALQDVRWYWRVEPKTKYYCDIDYDVFHYMEDNNKTYGFVINLYDAPQSIRTLWPTTLEFIAEHPEYVHPNNAMDWLVDADKRPNHNKIANGYSTCHFWSNFEIGDMDFFRSDAYDKYFEYLDQSGGFFYERWGDAPVHSIGLGLFLDKAKIHWFKDIGYLHQPYYNCPTSPKCKYCTPARFSDAKYLNRENCIDNWFKYVGAD